MADEAGQIDFYKPHRRAILPLDGFHAARTLRKSARRFEVRFDEGFDEIVHACSDREETWISPEIKASYRKLFDAGCAHCVGAYRDRDLEGGVYAAAFGSALFAESMFHRARDAGKVALWSLVQSARASGITLFEVQFLTPHLESLGAIEIDNQTYETMLAEAMAVPEVGLRAAP